MKSLKPLPFVYVTGLLKESAYSHANGLFRDKVCHYGSANRRGNVGLRPKVGDAVTDNDCSDSGDADLNVC